MTNLFTKTSINNCKTTSKVFAVLFMSILSMLAFTTSNAQEVLAGLTSNGGPEGRGTAFSIKTNGTGFSVIQGFADWGNNPNGDLFKDSDGTFYGMTSLGGTYNQGTIFKMTAAGVVTMLKHFNYPIDGASPYGELIKGTDGNFYGTTSAGGTNTYGTIFKMTPDGGTYTVLKHLSYAADGTNPRGHLVQAADGNFYGITYGGGANGAGTIFKMTAAGVYTLLRHLNKTTDGGNSYSSLTLGKDGNLYGITYGGGTFNYGTIFKITTAGVFTVLRHLNGPTDGGGSQSDLIQGSDGNFYGSCYGYGSIGNGTIFKITAAGVYTVLRHLFSTTDGGHPYGNLFQNSDGLLYGMNRTGGAAGAGTAFKITAAGAYTVLHSFLNDTEGGTPNAGFIKGNDGNLYALLSLGGNLTGGTVIKMTAAGAVTTLVNFNGAAKGNAPNESLAKGKDSAYYGTASGGGAYGYGTIFKICGGATTVLKSFNRNTDGSVPLGSLIQATDGNFYGMTSEGGMNGGYGTIFKVTPAGTYTVLRHLTGSTDGGSPYGSLIQATDGFLYGMTSSGGTNTGGTIFKISTTGTFTVLRHLAYATDGSGPQGNLIQATDGNLYGMTSANAKIFKITTTGTFTVLRSLVSGTDGSYPYGSLVQSSDGKLWGVTSSGGSFGNGTIFNITTTGTLKTMKHLNATPDGRTAKGDLLIAKDGNLYGVTSLGGANNVGTIFKISPSGTYTVLRHLNMATDGGNPFGGLVLAPVNNLIANPQSISTAEDVKKAITLTGSGGNPLTYNITTAPKRGKITGAGANKTYTPNANYTGKDSFYFSVSVGCISSDPAIVRITVTAVADTPVLAPVGNKSVIKNNALTFTATATDADKNTVLSYSLIGAPAGASMNAASGVFTWTPTTAGNFSFKVRATDNSALALYDEESITVTVTNSFAAMSASQEDKAVTKIEAAIYPNPVHDKAYITLNTPAEEVTVRIVDINGKVISTNAYQASGKNRIEINATTLSRGIYFAQVQTTEGNASLKFIKQ
ncbi:hypothetical protein BH10BAC2_BH10BAC2_18660 [soil metagenome]